MAQGLIESGQITLGNITLGDVPRLTRQDFVQVRQWLVPIADRPRYSNGLPSDHTVAEIVQTVDEFAPDLVHIWGTELYWGLLNARGYIHVPALLEMQGLKGAIAPVFDGGLSLKEQLACIGPKEAARGSTIFQGQRKYAIWGKVERQVISGFRFVTVQSKWLDAQVRAMKYTGKLFYNDFALRPEFYAADRWHAASSNIILCSAAYPAPFKGLHVAVRAAALLKQQHPDIELRIIGSRQRTGIHRDGYLAWLISEARRLGVDANLRWLGNQVGAEIIAQLQACAAFVLPSFVEGYSLTLAEAMTLGVPIVASYAGGIPSLAQDEDSALFFSPGDHATCAYQIERLMSDRALAESLARRAREIALTRNDRDRIVRRQIEIYRSVIAEG